MQKFNEMPVKMQAAVVLGIVLGLTIAAGVFFYKPIYDANQAEQEKLTAKLAENENLRQYEPKLQDIRRQIAMLKDQIEIQKRIVPDEKEADRFIHLMQDTAAQAGIVVRRYTAKATATKEFFTEAPFEMEIDGPYFAMLNFFDRVGRLERIINVGTLKMAALKKASDAGAKKKYDYEPGESVVATCLATTFYSHDLAAPPPAAAGGKPGAPAAGAAAPAAAPTAR
jgi:type IV pilus assembly protein PilO